MSLNLKICVKQVVKVVVVHNKCKLTESPKSCIKITKQRFSEIKQLKYHELALNLLTKPV